MVDLRARLQAALGDAYRIERELGGGGMSRVFLANEASLHRQVVVKVLPPEFASEVSEARFKQEIELSAQLQHPNILPVLTAGAKDDLLYYVMPFVSGESLRHRLTREGKLPVADAVRILYEIADALACAHAEGVIHRDVKPENILLLGTHAVLTDFGVARALADARSGSRLTDTGLALGTPGYMSPEQAAGERHVDARADVYALAVVGYEMLAGQPPFAGPTAQAVIAAHLTATPKPLADVRPESPPAVCNAIARALAKDPNARLRTAAEFRDAIGTAHARAAPRPMFRRRVLVASLVGVAALVVAAVLTLRPRGPARLDPNLLAVAPFEVLAPGQELWREGMVDALSRTLDGVGSLRTVSPRLVVGRWSGGTDPDAAVELGRRTGAQHVVLGEMLRAGPESVRVAARIIDANTKRLVGEIEVRQDAARMDRLVDSLTLGLLGALARAQPTGVARPTSWGAAPLPAVKAFLQGAQFYRRAAWDSALTSFGRALAIDSGFALALRGMRQVTWWGGVPSVSEAASREYALRAGTFNHGLAPRESLLIAAESLEAAVDAGALTDSGWWSHTRRYFSTMEEARARYPDDPDVWYQLGEARFHFGWFMGIPEVKAREAFDKAIALDSEFAPAYLHAFQLGLEQGGRAAAEHYLKSYLALKPSGAIGEAAGVLLQLLDPLTSRAAADSLLDTVARTRGPLGSVWYDVKRWPDSGETSVRLDSLIRQVGPKSGSDAAILERLYARDLAYRGHLHRAAEVAGSRVPGVLADLALLGAFPPDSAARIFARWPREQQALAVPWWSARRDTAALRAVGRWADSLVRFGSHVRDRIVARSIAPPVRAYLALARSDTTEALHLFETMPDIACPGLPLEGTGSSFCFSNRLSRAKLLEARGRDREAAEILDPGYPEATVPLEVPWTLERARLDERLGDRARAMTDYRFVADVWRNADPELQSYVAEARAALRRLGGEPRR